VSLLVVMGSGETAPTMVKVHREVLSTSWPSSGRSRQAGSAVMLDTPFGFQMNADELVDKTRRYFAESVGTQVEVASWRRADAPLVGRERALTLLAQAVWVFAGPGSPTYALRQWRGTPVPGALLDVAHRGGTLVFGSAAACTLGTHAIPVYEIYKVGEEPHWEPGLDLLGRLTGIEAVVIPHYDNAEGGGHDTRYCYLGEQRLAILEAELPAEVGVLGVDEHTALIVDLVARTARVAGNGGLTVRRHDRSQVFAAGVVLDLDVLEALLRGSRSAPAVLRAGPADGPTSPLGSPSPSGLGTADASPAPASLRAEAEQARERFDAALAAADVDGCVSAILALESAIVAWSADSLQSEDADRARRVLRSLVVRLGELARSGAKDPHEVVGPYVELLLDLRGRARASKDFTTSDLVRDRLASAGVEVRDTPDGATWSLREE
jgi:cyanophycinase-like exopeptidase